MTENAKTRIYDYLKDGVHRPAQFIAGELGLPYPSTRRNLGQLIQRNEVFYADGFYYRPVVQ